VQSLRSFYSFILLSFSKSFFLLDKKVNTSLPSICSEWVSPCLGLTRLGYLRLGWVSYSPSSLFSYGGFVCDFSVGLISEAGYVLFPPFASILGLKVASLSANFYSRSLFFFLSFSASPYSLFVRSFTLIVFVLFAVSYSSAGASSLFASTVYARRLRLRPLEIVFMYPKSMLDSIWLTGLHSCLFLCGVVSDWLSAPNLLTCFTD